MSLLDDLRLLKAQRDKSVICVRCLHVYNLNNDAVMVKTSRLVKKERACPRCECKVYFS
ncbi:hypothetical protein MYO4S_00265 [Serratia phage 4S]|nr:hypothetical protein MYO4S_00265 [Serratia phage 4S]